MSAISVFHRGIVKFRGVVEFTELSIDVTKVIGKKWFLSNFHVVVRNIQCTVMYKGIMNCGMLVVSHNNYTRQIQEV
jgi:hypothetical protein